jgi:hypothetical protein
MIAWRKPFSLKHRLYSDLALRNYPHKANVLILRRRHQGWLAECDPHARAPYFALLLHHLHPEQPRHLLQHRSRVPFTLCLQPLHEGRRDLPDCRCFFLPTRQVADFDKLLHGSLSVLGWHLQQSSRQARARPDVGTRALCLSSASPYYSTIVSMISAKMTARLIVFVPACHHAPA